MRLLFSIIFLSAWLNLLSQFQFEIIDIYPQDDPYVQKFTPFNDHLFFCALDGIHDYELWISDGTEEGTHLLIDINPNSYSDPDFLTVFDNRLFFSADDGVHGNELWVTDGTFEGTSLFIDINDTGSSEPKYLTVCGDKLYFSADNGINDRELWVSDGTEDGTQLLVDINLSGDASPLCLMPLSDKLLFWANETGVHNEKLWITDGTTNGTYMLKDIKKSDFFDNEKFVQFQSKVYFGAEDSINGRELWVSDGTFLGTYMVKDINPLQHSWGGRSSYPDHFYIYCDKIYFSAIDGIHNEELWVSDGTSSGTTLLKDINPSGNANPIHFYQYKGKLYFAANDGIHGQELWVTDGSPEQTKMLIDINPFGNAYPFLLTENAGHLFFHATIAEGGEPLHKLYVSDGKDNTFYVEPPNSINENPLSTVWEFCSFKNKLFLNARFTSINRALWMISDTSNLWINDIIIENHISIYPNPTNGMAFIKSTENLTAFIVTNLHGELIFTWNGKSKYVELDLRHEKSGIYLIKMYDDSNKSYSKKIIKSN